MGVITHPFQTDEQREPFHCTTTDALLKWFSQHHTFTHTLDLRTVIGSRIKVINACHQIVPDQTLLFPFLNEAEATCQQGPVVRQYDFNTGGRPHKEWWIRALLWKSNQSWSLSTITKWCYDRLNSWGHTSWFVFVCSLLKTNRCFSFMAPPDIACGLAVQLPKP